MSLTGDTPHLDATAAPRTLLLVDADDPVSAALGDELRALGWHIVDSPRTSPDDDDGADDARILQACTGESTPFDHAVFGIRTPFESPLHALDARRDDDPDAAAFDTLDSFDAFDLLATRIEARLGAFLDALRAAALQLARRGGGQIWVLTPEESLQHYLAFAAVPCLARAQQAAVKSLSKEVLRMNVRINCAAVQPVFEQFADTAWRAAADGLKAYAMKFRPNRAQAVARTLARLVDQPDLPIAGMIVPLALGCTENNV